MNHFKLLFIFLLAVQLLAGPYTRGPYLQNVSDQSMTIVWTGSETLTYGETNSYGLSAAVDYVETGTVGGTLLEPNNVVILKNLKPNTRYFYKVGSVDGTFLTAANQNQPFNFYVWGDMRGRSVEGSMEKYMVDNQANFIINLGDITRRGYEDLYNGFFNASYNVLRNTPTFPAHGGSHDGAMYFDMFRFPKTQTPLPTNDYFYSFDHGSVHFLAVNNYGTFNSTTSQNQQTYLSWMENDVLAARAKGAEFIVAYYHVQHFSVVSSSLTYNPDHPLVKMFEKVGVDLVFMAHMHDYEKWNVNGIPYILAGGGGFGQNLKVHDHPGGAFDLKGIG